MLRTLITVALVVVAGAARAQQTVSQDGGFSFGARLGYAHPLGNLAGEINGPDVPLDDSFERAIPLVFEAGYRFARTTFGLYYQYGFASVDSGASIGAGSCSQFGATCDTGRVKRYGLQLTHAFPGSGTVAPWVGGAIGLERASLEFSEAGETADVTFKGFDLTFQGGADFQAGPRFFVGPYLSVSFGRFSDLEIEVAGFTVEGELDEPRWHEWIQAGIRARFDL